MTSTAANSSHPRLAESEDDSLCAALEEYQRRTERGEMPELEIFVQEYPQVAAELRACLASLQQIHQLALSVPAVEDVNIASPLDVPACVLGDFRILHELGRGGMGIVYEAEQLSLGCRHVALKVLPFAGMLDERQLRRFKLEAAAAAMLKHPHIVSIIWIGVERGVNYYAMELIHGQTLAQLIDARKAAKASPRTETKSSAETAQALHDTTARPSEFFRAVAALGIQAAEALDHAHQQGIIHRDVKPSNLMVDARGNVSITDFGLAHIEASPGITLTGDLLGTLRYMSPEQASGQSAYVDPRTDVYSLGATLYELATDRPAVQGQDRAAILREIAETDPARPRTHTPGMPADLETILLKCLAKEPSARYATAKALAEDLRRFLECKPVVAKRPGALDGLAKWSRRHRALLTVCAAALLVTTIAAAAAAIVSWRSYIVAQRALDERTQALKDANENLELAGTAIERMLARTGSAAWQHGDLEDSRQLLADAVRLLDNLSKRSDNSDVLEKITRANLQIHLVYISLDSTEDAWNAVNRGLALARTLYRRNPQNRDVNLLLASALNDQGGLYTRLGNVENAGESYGEAVAIAEALLAEHDADVEVVRALQQYLDGKAGIEHEKGRFDSAAAIYRRIDALYESLPRSLRESPTELSGRAASLHNEAMLARDRNNLDEAMRLVDQALGFQRRASSLQPGHPRRREYLANHTWLRAQLLVSSGGYDEALQAIKDYSAQFNDQLDAEMSMAQLLLELAGRAGEDASTLVEEAERAIRRSLQAGHAPPLLCYQVAELLSRSLPLELQNPVLAHELTQVASSIHNQDGRLPPAVP